MKSSLKTSYLKYIIDQLIKAGYTKKDLLKEVNKRKNKRKKK